MNDSDEKRENKRRATTIRESAADELSNDGGVCSGGATETQRIWRQSKRKTGTESADSANRIEGLSGRGWGTWRGTSAEIACKAKAKG